MSAIPASVLERGERAFVEVLRGDFPDCCFVPGDAPVRPEDADAVDEVATGAPVDLDSIEEATEDDSAPGDVEAFPMLGERSSDRKPIQAGG